MAKNKTFNFDIFKQAGPSRTSVWVMLQNGKVAGRIITAWPNDGAGRVKVAVMAWEGVLKDYNAMLGQAVGNGYDKESAAVQDAFNRHGFKTGRDLSGRGMSTVGEYFAALGYQLERVL